jgi:hypothetical protein
MVVDPANWASPDSILDILGLPPDAVSQEIQKVVVAQEAMATKGGWRHFFSGS